MTPSKFASEIADIKFVNTFNPYADTCPVHDRKDSAKCRRRILLSLLESATSGDVDALWIGRDLGYKGGRRTGLALTDDVNFTNHLARWGLEFDRPTSGLPIGERTATVVWNLLNHISSPIFLWNVFPLHPHNAGHSFTNRSHNSLEKRAGEEILATLVRMLRPRQIVAIGNDALVSATKVAGESEIIHARHPSYGGQADFIHAIQKSYNITNIAAQAELFS